MKVLANNPKARHDYAIEETLEAGIALSGGEVKSIRAGHISLKEAFVSIRKGEAFLMNTYIKPYADSSDDPTRPRKLLLHRTELDTLVGAAKSGGRTVVPTKLYLKKGLMKLQIALATGKKNYDKRQALKAKQAKREAEQAIKQSQR
jgi:SsrA-binding protein